MAHRRFVRFSLAAAVMTLPLSACTGALGPDGEHVDGLHGPLDGPSEIDFGEQEVETTSAPETVILTNDTKHKDWHRKARVLHVRGTHVEGPFSAPDTVARLDPGEQLEVPVTFRPAEEGPADGRLVVELHRGADYVVDLKGRGVAGTDDPDGDDDEPAPPDDDPDGDGDEPVPPDDDPDGDDDAPEDPSEHLAMLVTAAELEMWRRRAAEGPFKTAGDHSPGSPGAWADIESSADRIDADPSYGEWEGPPGDGPVTRDTPSDGLGWPETPRRWARELYDAAIYALVTEDLALAEKVREAVISQSHVDRVDFTDGSQWDCNFHDVGLNFALASLMRDLLIAWDIAVTATDLPGDDWVDTWFGAYGHCTAGDYDRGLENVFPNRNDDDYSVRSSFVDSTDGNNVAYTTSAGDVVESPRIMRFYNNRRHHLAAIVGLIGVYLDDAELIDDAKRYARETVMFGFRRDGVYGDSNRFRSDLPQLSLGYALSFGGVVEFVDALARTGDTSVYDFVTSEGSASAGGMDGTAAPDKSFREMVESFARHTRRDWDQYGTSDPGEAGDTNYLLNPLAGEMDGRGQWVSDAKLLRAALYYGDATLNETFTRQHPDAVGWDEGRPRNGWDVDAARNTFLVGDVLGEVSPYDGGAP